MRIALVASECAPLAKVGGLADAVGGLGRALARRGHEVAVILPRYPSARCAPARPAGAGSLELGGRRLGYRWWEVELEAGLRAWLLEQPELYDRRGIYGTSRGDWPDNDLRFAFLCHAALGLLGRLRPDVVHVHDWQAALLPALLRLRPPAGLEGVRTVLTVHNLGYQGAFPPERLALTGLPPEAWGEEGVGREVNFLKAGILWADVLTTVSPTYARQIQTPEFGFGLDGLLRSRREALHGILNGADYEVWDPRVDPFLPVRYDEHHLEGKGRCKRHLSRQLGLAPDRPLLGFVGRLCEQKGVDLLLEAWRELRALGTSLVVLGSGQERLERALRERGNDGHMAVHLGFNEALAHRIVAGCDLLLIPSRYEPCGLNQIYALRYGTLPVAHATGGLADTLWDFDGREGTGFTFKEPSPRALVQRVVDALDVYERGHAWRRLQRQAMRCDFSWDRPVREYLRLYGKRAEEGEDAAS